MILRKSRLLLIPLWCGLVLLTGFSMAEAGVRDACRKWREVQLLVDRDAENRRFILEQAGPLQAMPAFGSVRENAILHRTYALSFDNGGNVSLYHGRGPDCCRIGRDDERKAPFRVPVFFIGRAGEKRETLEEKVARLQFSASRRLSEGADFSEVNFQVLRGGSLFGEIQPFFRCGLPGLLVCTGACPSHGEMLFASLVSWVVSGEKLAEKPLLTPSPLPAPPKGPAIAEPKPVETKPETPKITPLPAPGPPAKPVPPPAPQAQAPRPASPQPPAQTKPEPLPAPAPKPAEPAKPEPLKKQLIVTFQKSGGIPISAADVLKAEGRIVLEGVVLEPTSGGLGGDFTEADYARASQPANIAKIFERHRVVASEARGGQFVLTVEPLYVRAADVRIKIQNAAGMLVAGCALTLEVVQERQFGGGWDRAAKSSGGGAALIDFQLADSAYRAKLPAGAAENELLLSTAQPGNAAILSSSAAECPLELRPAVTVDELKSLAVTRDLRTTGPVFFGIVTTDSTFSAQLPGAADGFWTKSLELINAVSMFSWERKVLARAQEQKVWKIDYLDHADRTNPLANTPEVRANQLKILREGSETKPDAAFEPVKPLKRFELDSILRNIREKEVIPSVQSRNQEGLLLVSGSVKQSDSEFCLRAIRGDAGKKPDWMAQIRRAFVIELWSDTVRDAMQRQGVAEAVSGAPAGIFRCKIGGADGDKVNLYGISPATVQDASLRDQAFAYLTAQASSFLKP